MPSRARISAAPSPAAPEPRPARAPADLPARAGVGLKPQHYYDALAAEGALGFVEIHAENYMGAGGPPHRWLSRIRERVALSVHGVGLSLGGAEALDVDHLDRLARLCDRYQPEAVSEHLAWAGHGGRFLNDLLPLPYTEATLAIVCAHVDQVQSRLKRRILIENPSVYLAFAHSEMSEPEFLRELARRSGCGLLLDVNNVYVSANNTGGDAAATIDAFPVEHVGEIHLAGFAVDASRGPRLLIDTHGARVDRDVWALFARALARTGPVATLIEWDTDVPGFDVLLDEAAAADAYLARAATLPAAVRVA